MGSDLQVLKKCSKIAVGVLVVLLLGSAAWFKERVFFADAAYILFNIIEYKTLAIQFGRYGSFITQVVPLIGATLHLPLWLILIGYACSFSLFNLAVVCLLIFRYRQYGLGILATLFYCLFVSDSWFWISEIPQGAGWMFLLFGMSLYHGHKKTNILLVLPLFVILTFLVVFTHFVLIIPTAFLWVYFILEKENWPYSKNRTILLSCILIGMVIVKFLVGLLSPQAAGEAMHLHGVTHVSFKDIFESFSTPVVRMFVYRCGTNYWAGVLVLALGLAALFRNKNKALAGWVVLCIVGYMIIMGLTYGDDDEHVQLFHIESEWVCIGILVATPFVFAFLPKIKLRAAAVILTAIFIIRLAYIVNAAADFSWRIGFQQQVLDKMKEKGITKLALYREHSIGPQYKLDWASNCESLLLSSMEGDAPERSFFFINDEHNEKILEELSQPSGVMYGELVRTAPTNHDYFTIDTLLPYRVMRYKDLIK